MAWNLQVLLWHGIAALNYGNEDMKRLSDETNVIISMSVSD